MTACANCINLAGKGLFIYLMVLKLTSGAISIAAVLGTP
jgi:hypothetical protein